MRQILDPDVLRTWPAEGAEAAVISWIMAAKKAVDERLYLSRAKGGGVLRREIWVDGQGRVVRYNLAYINHLIYAGDNGRVIGYDSAHGHHHRHLKGETRRVNVKGFEEIEARFEKELRQLLRRASGAKE